jgi:hypothetical protein
VGNSTIYENAVTFSRESWVENLCKIRICKQNLKFILTVSMDDLYMNINLLGQVYIPH